MTDNLTMSPSFSVVVTNHNYQRFLVEAVDSALRQSRPPDQVIVVDDGSTDDSVALLRARFGDEARLRLIAQDNRGQLGAFISGVGAATGEVIAFLDADDRWAPDHLQRLALAYGGDSRPDCVYTNLQRFGDAGGLWHSGRADRDRGLTALPALVRLAWEGSPTSALSMRRRLAQEILDLPASWVAAWRTRADDVLIYGASLLLGRKHYLAEPSVHYRVHGGNAWFSLGRDPVADLRYAYRREALVAHFARRAGLSHRSLRKAREEFRTHAQPTLAEALEYCALAWQAPAPVGKRLELLFGIGAHWWRRRRPA